VTSHIKWCQFNGLLSVSILRNPVVMQCNLRIFESFEIDSDTARIGKSCLVFLRKVGLVPNLEAILYFLLDSLVLGKI
jgi:hypothetical protein